MIRYCLLLLFPLLSSSCGEDEDCITPPCGPDIEIVAEPQLPFSDSFSLLDARVDGLCLSVEVGASGCSSEGWSMRLLTDGNVLLSLPTQSGARLVFDDGVEDFTCQAFWTETFTFDLTPYLGGAQPTYFSIAGTETVFEIR